MSIPSLALARSDPGPATLDLGTITQIARERLGEDAEPDELFTFTLTLLHLRELDRNLRALNGMRLDMEWLKRHEASDCWPSKSVPQAVRVWLQEDEAHRRGLVLMLRTEINHARETCPRAAEEAEKIAFRTYGEQLELTPD